MPIKLSVEAICRQDASLLTADVAIKFMFECLKENTSTLSEEFQAALKCRIEERRTDLSSLLQYLHNQYQPSEEETNSKKCKSQQETFNDIFTKMNKNAIVKRIVSIIERLDKEVDNGDAKKPAQPEKEDEPGSASAETLSLQQKLQLAILKGIPGPSEKIEKTPNSLLKIIKRDSNIRRVEC